MAQFRTIYPGYNGVPFTDTVTITTKQLNQNSLLTRFLNYRTGFNKTAKEYLAAIKSCVGQTSIEILCGFAKPVNDISDIYAADTVPCRAVQTQSAFIAQLIYQQRKDSLIANFDSLYKAKCLGAKFLEQFYNSYTPKEYHYTLYYYDQAGNLAKTLPPLAVKPNYSLTYLAQISTARTAATDQVNTNNNALLATQYRYNSLNQVVVQKTPDAGTSNFWYDRLGRLVVSQNAKQATGKYSYTLYDVLGRIIEVGQKPQAALMKQYISQDTTALKNWMNGTGVKEQITLTSYDSAYSPLAATQIGLWQKNLRNRVSYTYAKALDDGNPLNWDAATFYSYDIHGNVDTLLQDYKTGVMNTANNRFKRLVYSYDLISGKVNDVAYQQGWADQFYHHYEYDAENKLTEVKTSKDKVYWEREALYDYYRHGPLARTVLGQNQVQGVDYAYTIQGWLKGVNSTSDPIAGTLGNGNDCGANSAVNDLTVNLRQTPYDDYKARSTITFQPGFESNASDNFETFIDTSLTACTNTTGIAGDDLYGGHAIYDMGKDGFTNSTGSFISTGRNIQTPDAYGFSLNYFTSDYKPINASVIPFANIGISNDLFNGNIKAMSVNIPKLGDALTYGYNYDQLNRLVATDAYNGVNSGNNTFTPISISDYKERLSYDPNGNIVRLSRNGSGTPLFMDSLAYNYKPNTNQLDHVNDSVAITNYTTDIDDQAPNNYQYDAIGNLTADTKESITGITWSVYGKILSITKAGSTITYTYDASGNRISKTASGITTWYVRDASGNVMSVYMQGDNTKNAGVLTQSETHLYGSSRLGGMNYNVNCTNLVMPSLRLFTRGNKFFELSNHLGNVLVTISDKRLQHTTDNTTVDYYNADVVTANDYYPFGSLMPGRNYNAPSAKDYRYGFNGKENDNDVKGEGNQQDYGMRIYDSRLGRFLSVDPISKKYPNLTPYQFASNTPIQAIDQDGLEAFFVHGTEASNKRWFHPMTDESPVDNTLINGFLPLTRNTVPPDVTFNWHRIVSDGYNPRTGEKMSHSVNRLTNNEPDRKIAAQDLVEHVMTYRRVHGIDTYNGKGELVKMGNEPITFITHSHGGNVAIQAANMIFDKHKVQSDIIAIAVPAFTGKNDAENPANARGVRKLIDIWNPTDKVSGQIAPGSDDYYPIGPNSKVRRIEVDASKYYKNVLKGIDAHSFDNNHMQEFIKQVKSNPESKSLIQD